MAKKNPEFSVTPQMILYELSAIALRTGGEQAGLPPITQSVKVAEQLKALELIGKHLGMFGEEATVPTPALTLVCDYGIQGETVERAVLEGTEDSGKKSVPKKSAAKKSAEETP